MGAGLSDGDGASVGGSAGSAADSAAQRSPGFRPTSEKGAMLLLKMAIKCSDVGHLTLGWESHVRWVCLLEDEMFAQGDREREAGLSPISFLMDREKPGATETQVGFFDFVVLPLFQALVDGLPGAAPMLEGAKDNYRRWKEADAAEGGAREALRPLKSRLRLLGAGRSPSAEALAA